MRKDLVVFRCEDCIKNLEEYNPYVYETGEEIPLDKIEVIKVDKQLCENNELNRKNTPHLQAPILLTKASDTPWEVKFWDSIYDHEQGISEIYGKYESFSEAEKVVEESAEARYWASYEIILVVGEDEYPVYTYSRVEPLADEFVRIDGNPKLSLDTGKQCVCGGKPCEQKYKVYVHFDGCLDYIVDAKDEDTAKEDAIELFSIEKANKIISMLDYKVCDCELLS